MRCCAVLCVLCANALHSCYVSTPCGPPPPLSHPPDTRRPTPPDPTHTSPIVTTPQGWRDECTLTLTKLPYPHEYPTPPPLLPTHSLHVPHTTPTHRHDSVSEVEGLLHPITMVDVNVHIQHSGELLWRYVSPVSCDAVRWSLYDAGQVMGFLSRPVVAMCEKGISHSRGSTQGGM